MTILEFVRESLGGRYLGKVVNEHNGARFRVAYISVHQDCDGLSVSFWDREPSWPAPEQKCDGTWTDSVPNDLQALHLQAYDSLPELMEGI